MNKKLLFIALLLASFTQTTYGQWALGDIAFTGYQGDNSGNPSGETDQFTFVLLRDVAAGELISFTENGWFAAGGFRTGESTVTLEFTSALNCGTQISISATPFVAIEDGGGMSAGNLTGTGMALSVSGDQIFAYDPGNTPSAGNESGFIAAIQMNGGWDADATSTTTSAQPAIFTTLAFSSIAIDPEIDNAVYNCTDLEDDDVNVLRAAIHDPANWNTNNDTPFDQPACGAISCTTLSSEVFGTNDPKSFVIFPNPSNGNITIKNPGIPLQSVIVSDLNGRTLKTYEFGGIRQSKDIQLNLGTGVYFVQMNSDTTTVTEKVVIN
ncbi:putative secreted protein (Por secretion system target) [Kordia periserrulae]|uniref:Putative secreted protein (Por secretion system target) n=1 Tax=Kordia periserrulae TaxID=701523 RepID=A0A2T6C482_9FLAO|nr:T9SS type A sorting domain-containing protein [Kordia periserrulae]PTX63114.1 putative secreted protein (Por secretion system target) [Kordia periserrulae]